MVGAVVSICATALAYNEEYCPPSSITLPPMSQNCCQGATVNFTENASGGGGAGPLGSLWSKDGIILHDGVTTWGSTISGATTCHLTISNVGANDAASYSFYSAIINNNCIFEVSGSAILTVNTTPLLVTLNPMSQTACGQGSTVNFTVEASGTAPLSYQWRKNGTNISDGVTSWGSTNSGAATMQLTISRVSTNDAASYDIVVNDVCHTAFSSPAILMVDYTCCKFPSIILNPANRTGSQGSTVNFKVWASGTAPLSYQWRKNGIILTNGVTTWESTISGATTPQLTISNVSADDGAYDVVVNNTCGTGGTAFSSPATLMVDSDGDGLPDNVDADPYYYDYSLPAFTISSPAEGAVF